jgi:diguanylate cyclase (GGDEF)-like protein
MHLDIDTLGIIAFLMTAVLSLGFTMMALLLATRRALWLWSGVLWLTSLGTLLSVLRDRLPAGGAMMGVNSCFVVANALVLAGVAVHLGRRLDRRGPALLSGMLITGFAVVDLVAPDVTARMLLFSLQFMVWDGWIIALLLSAPASLRRSTRVAAAVFSINLLFHAIRALVLIGGATKPQLETGSLMAGTIVFGIVMGLMKTFALVLLMVEQLVDALRKQARIDGLTGLLNRDAIFEEGAKTLAACRRGRQPCAVLMFDLDNFKRINDQRGHGAGDAVLRHFADLAREQGPGVTGLLARYGGEEFLLVLPNTDAAAAMAVAEDMRHRLASTPACFGPQSIAITTSIGVAVASGETRFEYLVAMADEALYRAKDAGRNRTVVAAFQSSARAPGLVTATGEPAGA